MALCGYCLGVLGTKDPDFDVNALAQKFGGGGHKNAAGGSINTKTVEEALEALNKILDQS